jgi:hypothetical protein
MMRAPNAKLVRLVDAQVEPLSLTDAKNFLRVETDDDDMLIGDLITAARLRCETINNRSFINTSWQFTIDYFPPYSGRLTNILPALAFGVAALGGRSLWVNMEEGAIRLPNPPLVSVDSITYLDVSGTLQTLSPALTVVSTGTPGQIAPQFGQIFPLTLPVLSAVNIQYTAGYGPDSTSVPKTVIQAVRVLTACYYEHRTSDVPTPSFVVDLLDATSWGGY